MIDFLLSPDVVAQSGLPPLTQGTPEDTSSRPIRLDPGLLKCGARISCAVGQVQSYKMKGTVDD